MVEPIDLAETRQGMILQELAGLGMALARDLQARALAAESNEEAVKLAGAFHRVARAVRQTLALEPRLVRDHTRNRREAEVETARETAERTERKKARLKLTLERLVWSEVESVEAERLVDDLDELIEAAALADGFDDEPFEALVETIRAGLGLAAAAVYSLDGKSVPPHAAPEAPAAAPNSS
jgi:hypothetical protein